MTTTTPRPPHILPPRAMLERAEWDYVCAAELRDLAVLDLDKVAAPTVLAQIEVGLIHARAASTSALWALEEGPKARIGLRVLSAHLRLLADLIEAVRAEVERAEGDDT